MRAGQRDESLAAINRTFLLLEGLHGESPANPEYLTELAESYLTVNLDSPTVRMPVARRLFEQAVRYAGTLGGLGEATLACEAAAQAEHLRSPP